MSCELIKGGAFVDMYSEASGIALETFSSEASVAILIFEKYVNGAVIQWNRIQEVKQLMVRGVLNGTNQSTNPAFMQRLFLEVYFYYLCYDKARIHLSYFVKSDGDPELESFWQDIKSEFKPFYDALANLESVENGLSSRHLFELGNLEAEEFVFGGERFNIGREGLKLLTAIYEQVIELVKARKEQCP